MTVSGLGERLSAVRRQEKLSQEEMAERLGVSRSAYQYYERGERDLTGSLLLRILETFGVDPLWILEGDSEAGMNSREREISQAYRAIGLAVENRINESSIVVSADKKWDAIDFLFAEFLEAERSQPVEAAPDAHRIDSILRLVA